MKKYRERIRSLVAKIFRTLFAALREIFDEAAYSRFLNRAGMVSSSESYAVFCREFEEAKTRRQKIHLDRARGRQHTVGGRSGAEKSVA
jgi:hypothetical protein